MAPLARLSTVVLIALVASARDPQMPMPAGEAAAETGGDARVVCTSPWVPMAECEIGGDTFDVAGEAGDLATLAVSQYACGRAGACGRPRPVGPARQQRCTGPRRRAPAGDSANAVPAQPRCARLVAPAAVAEGAGVAGAARGGFKHQEMQLGPLLCPCRRL